MPAQRADERQGGSFGAYLLRVLFANRGLCSLTLAEHRAIHAEWIGSRATGGSPLDLGLPWISVSAKRALERLLGALDPAEARIFEYGAGGSTLFLRRYAAVVETVEHDPQWHATVCARLRGAGLDAGSVHLVEPEPADRPPSPAEAADPAAYRSLDPRHARATFRRYATFIERFPGGHFDLVLVDGRSRPSCLAHALPAVRPGGLLVLDNAERGYYLSAGVLRRDGLELLHTGLGALVASAGFTRTDIYRRSR